MERITEERIGRLERDVRRVRGVLLLLLVVASGLLLAMVLPRGRAEAVAVFAATALLLAGAETAVSAWRRGQRVPDIVRAKKFEVVDERGHIFVEIGETTDGRGAVVTHDGDTHVILSPAHPPVERKQESRTAQASGATGHAGGSADAETVLTPAHEDGEPATAGENGGRAAPESAPAPHAQENVKIELVYRGDGTYEAKITERDESDTRRPGRRR